MMLWSDYSFGATERKLEGFKSLPSGWHYGDGGPLTERQATSARAVLTCFNLAGLNDTDVFFGADGTVMVTAYSGDDYYEVEIDNGIYNFRHLQKESPVDEQQSLSDQQLYLIILPVQREQWTTYDLSTRTHMTTAEGNLIISASRTLRPIEGVARASYAFHAPKLREPYVNTFVNTTRGLAESRQSFGFFSNQLYPQVAA